MLERFDKHKADFGTVEEWLKDRDAWLARYEQRREMVVWVWKYKDEFGWWRWECKSLGIRCYDKWHDRESAIADAKRVADELGLRMKVEGE